MSAAGAAAAPAVANKGLITLSIMLATIMQVLDTTIANVALPSMQGSLGAAQDQITWVLTSYIVASAIMTPVTGWLSDRMGLRELFIASVAGFVAASMLCGMATSLGGVRSSIESRRRWEGERVPDGLLRLSVGLEDADELWADLEQALARA